MIVVVVVDDDVVVVVECYCFLINIIVEPSILVPPPVLMTVLHFLHFLHPTLQYSYGKTMTRQNQGNCCCSLFSMNVSHFRPVGFSRIC